MMEKVLARKNTLKIRNSMDEGEVDRKSEMIVSRLLESPYYKNAQVIMAYMDFKNEVKTGKIIETAFSDGKRVIIPYTDTVDVKVIPVEINGLEDLVYSKYGYLEPRKEATEKPFLVENIDLIVVPGVAFDLQGNRVGFGKGYYDKILIKRKQNCAAIAIAYDFQVYDCVEVLEHDIKMNEIITESRVITIK